MSASLWGAVKDAFAPGRRALVRNLPPVLLLQAAIIAMVVAWFASPSVRALARGIADWKDHASLVAVFLVGAFAGGLLPELAKCATGRLKFGPAWLGLVTWSALTYGCVGLITNFFYAWLAEVVGRGADIRTVAIKTVIDVGVVTPLVFIPFIVTMFTAYREGFSVGRIAAVLRDRFFLKRVVPTVAMAWGYWVPILCAMYALPLPLQFPMAMLAEGAWSIMVVFVNVSSEPES